MWELQLLSGFLCFYSILVTAYNVCVCEREREREREKERLAFL
jgi:hypothetical protein